MIATWIDPRVRGLDADRSRDDRWHETVRALLDGESGPLVVPAVVIPEVDHLLGVRSGHAAQLALYEDLVAGVYLTVDLEADGYARVLELVPDPAGVSVGEPALCQCDGAAALAGAS